MTREPVDAREILLARTRGTIGLALLLGIAGLAVSPAGGPAAALLDVALLGLARWLSRRPAVAVAVSPGHRAMSGNQGLLLLLALGGAAVLVASGAASRPVHGVAVAPFAMAAFALSSRHSRDLRSGILAATAALLVLSAADDRGFMVALCAAGLVPLVFGWVAVRQVMALDRRPELNPVVSGGGARPWLTWTVVRLVLLTAVASLLLPTEPLPHGHEGQGDPGQEQADPGQRGDMIASGVGQLNLDVRGGLDSQPVIGVPADSPTLWAGTVFDEYTGYAWNRTSTSRQPVKLSIQPLPRTEPLPAAAGVTVSEVQHLSDAFGNPVYAPGPVVGVDAAAGELYDFGGQLSVTHRGQQATAYEVAWRDPEAASTPAVPDVAPSAPVQDPSWLALPAELPQRVRDLARTVTAGTGTTQDAVAAVETYLRTHEKYELDSPVPADGTDAVDAFLFKDHVGFCEQFASAEAVLLRAVGIPARVAAGFGGDGAPSADGRTRVYRNQDAHAWVQVGYPGEHWLDSDPTAGTELAPPGLRHRFSSWLQHRWQLLKESPAQRRRLGFALLACALVGWLLVRLVRRLPRAKARRKAPPARETVAGRAYQRLLDRLSEQERPRRPNETVRDLLLRLRAPDLEAVASVLESEWYASVPAVPADELARAVAVLDALAQEAPVLLVAAP